MKLLIATQNQDKLKEFQFFLKPLNLTLVNPLKLKSIPSNFDVPETGKSFKQNAILKAKAYGQKANLLSLADDSGLMIDYLHGQPGLYSKRFAKDGFINARQLILTKLASVPRSKRTARFICTLALFDPSTNTTKTFTATTHGWIALKEQGTSGFGYDPIFMIDQHSTYASIAPQKKNQLSHRALAFKKLVNYLKIPA